jgi:hypothetical protein
MRNIYVFAIASILSAGCANLQDAEQTDRSTFVRFYEIGNSFLAAEAMQTGDGGYIIAGTIEIEGENPVRNIVVIKTDRFGQKQWEKLIEGGKANSINHIEGLGYVLACDSVALEPNSTEIADLENTSARVIILDDENGDVVIDRSFTEKITNDQGETQHIDTHALGVTRNSGGDLMVLGSRRRPKDVEFTTVSALNVTTLIPSWSIQYDFLNRDYANSNSIFFSGSDLVWASNVKESSGNFTKSYISVPRISGNSGFVSSEYYGQNNEQLDMQISCMKPDGYGGFVATGSYAETDGSKSNIFSIKINSAGKFRSETIRHFDYGSNGQVSEATSLSQDTGGGITPTSDGGVLIAGNTLKESGNDIWLIKLDRLGEIQWSKILGGRSNEEVSSIYETNDKGFIICGTLRDGDSQTGGLSSVFLIKTDSKGELAN